MNSLGNVCYCRQFPTVLSRVRSAIRAQKNQRDRILSCLTSENIEKTFPYPGFVGPARWTLPLDPSDGPCLLRQGPTLHEFCFDLEGEKTSQLFSRINDQGSRIRSLKQQLGMGPVEKERPPRMRVESDKVECVVLECSEKVRTSFKDLFPLEGAAAETLSAVVMSHNTTNDMSIWSSDMELERDELTAQFVELGKEIVDALRANDVWADFIDPSSGRPFYSSYTHATFFDTDERYKHFGFSIQDLGCCKSLEHPVWGTKAFVGCIFTSASSDHLLLKEIIQSKIE